jgi:hypothetical protein
MAFGGTMPFAGGGDAPANPLPGSQPLWTASHGLAAEGAHWVDGPTFGSVGDTSVLYGEALSGNSREYAFPMDEGGWRFITEQPGFDEQSFALWADLGARKGFFGDPDEPQPERSAGQTQSSSFSSSFASAAPPREPAMIQPNVTVVMAGGGAPAQGQFDKLERRMANMETSVVEAVRENTAATLAIPAGVRSSVAHNLEHDRDTRKRTVRGLSKEAGVRKYEGTF